MRTLYVYALALILSSCAQQTAIPVPVAPSEGSGGNATPDDSSGKNAALARTVHSSLPIGTKIYMSDTMVADDGQKHFVFPASAQIQRTAENNVVVSNGRGYTFSSHASFRIEKNTIEQYVLLGDPTPAELLGKAPDVVTTQGTPVKGGGGGGTGGSHAPSYYAQTYAEGCLGSVGGTASDVYFSFNSDFEDDVDVNFSVEFFTQSGSPITTLFGDADNIDGNGNIDFTSSLIPANYWSAKVVLTVQSDGAACAGNGSLQGY